MSWDRRRGEKGPEGTTHPPYLLISFSLLPFLPEWPARYTAFVASEIDPERAYYRAVEDLFATLRGVPHTLSPRDFQLLRDWWQDEVPLSAVRAGITEVFARRRERGEIDPIVSLGYCRHAVRSHAKRAAEMQVGAHDVESTRADPQESVHALSKSLSRVADQHRSTNPRLADVLDAFSVTVAGALELPPSALEEHLFALESALLATCLEALDDRLREKIEKCARREAEAMSVTAEARERSYRALRDRLLREELDLPRLELAG